MNNTDNQMNYNLYTLNDMAKKLGINPSTLKNYKDRFTEYLPSEGEGKRKRYKEKSIEVLKYIADAISRNETQEMIERGLSQRFTRQINVEWEIQEDKQKKQDINDTQTKGEISLQDLAELQFKNIKELTQGIIRLAIAQEKRNQILETQVALLSQQVLNLGGKIDGLEQQKALESEKDNKVFENTVDLQEADKKETEKKLPWYKRWFP